MIPVSKNVYIARIPVAIGQIIKKLYIYIEIRNINKYRNYIIYIYI